MWEVVGFNTSLSVTKLFCNFQLSYIIFKWSLFVSWTPFKRLVFLCQCIFFHLSQMKAWFLIIIIIIILVIASTVWMKCCVSWWFFSLPELLRRPAINRSSKLIEDVIETNNTENLKSYFEAGCINTHDGVQSTKKCMFLSRLQVSEFVDNLMLVLVKLISVLHINENWKGSLILSLHVSLLFHLTMCLFQSEDLM